jgi:hypothetical protein
MSRLSHFLDNRLTDGGEVSLTCWPPGIFLVRISVRRINPRAIVWLEGLGTLIKSSNFIGKRNRDLPACRIVSQPTKLLHASDTGNGTTEIQ